MDLKHRIAPVRNRDLFADRYQRSKGRLTPSFARVAAFIDANRLDVIALPAVDLAKLIGTSDATVVRAVRALGFPGLHELRRELASSIEGRNAPSDNLERTWEVVGDTAEAAMDDVLTSLQRALEVLRGSEIRAGLLAALKLLQEADRIVVFGIGPTGHIANYFAARLRRKGRRQFVLDRTGAELADQLLELRRGDRLLMLAYGTAYREAEATVSEARRLNIPFVLITDAPDGPAAQQAATVLAIPRGTIGQVALHGTTVACLEMLLLGLATTGSGAAVAALGELDRLREMTRPTPRRKPR